jgi:hypothetical protein
MPTTTARIRSTALALLTATATLIPATSAASAGRTKTLHFYAKETSFTFTAADGSVPRTPPANPKPGDSFDETDIAYLGTHTHHATRWTGSSHLRCIFATTAKLSCESQIAIDGSLILTKGDAHTALKIIGGAGRFLHATGTVTSTVAGDGVDATVTYRQ